ncbi:MAG: phenylalanine--tRNA ligase subunit beta [Candidatus Paceibacterota bacterium]|jgi:phenylalanyl-tRNA synthetase beta chain
MKVSYKWINEYLNGKAPSPEKVENLLTMHSMEVEGLEKVKSDTVLDVKTLPNNSHSCLCHRGIAREVGVVANLKVNSYSRKFKDISIIKTSKNLEVKIEDGKLCRRYIGRVIENIKVGPSPKWLIEKLETLGQRSINNIVDATNFVMLEIGQPMHAFDSDKIGNEIVVKNSYRGQRIITLDKKDVELDENVLLITDGENPLAIAGVKGGNYAELEIDTKNIILESASFDPVLIRKTAQRIKIQTDASKRYENDLTQEICGEAMDILTKLIVEIAGTKDTKVGEVIDNYPNKAEKVKLGISATEASSIIGVEIKDKDIENIFGRFGFEWQKEGDKFVIAVPMERLDLRIKEDLAEEIGRIYGYEKIGEVPLPKNLQKVKIDKGFAYKEKIRRILYEQGFSEVMNYSFTDKGEIELSNPMSPERKFLRTNLTDGLKNSLELNARYSELIDMPQIKIFEFGHVFKNRGEENNFIIGIKNPLGLKKPKEKETLDNTLKILSEKLNIDLSSIKIAGKDENIAEFNFEKALEKLPDAIEYITSEIGDKNKRYKKISQYPFMIRDIAVFTPEKTKPVDVFSVIEKEAGELMIKSRLFDVFAKTMDDGIIKTSYAYRLIFQSYKKTLSDEEINAIMEKITAKMNAKTGWQVR